MSDYFESVKKVRLPGDLFILAAHFSEKTGIMRLLTSKPYDRTTYILWEYSDGTDKLKQIAKAKTPESLIKMIEEVDSL